jgi:iron complex outermembrane receptor protein
MRLGMGLALLGVFWAAEAMATDHFINTRLLLRHAGKELADIPSYADMLVAPTAFPYRQAAVPVYEPFSPKIARPTNGAAFTGGFQSSANIWLGGARGDMSIGDTKIGAAARYEEASAFHDAAGRRYDYSYKRNLERIAFTHGKKENGQVTVDGLRDVFDDSRLPNYGTDGDLVEQLYLRAGFEKSGMSGLFDSGRVGFSFYNLFVQNDNFRLRAPGSFRLDYEVNNQEFKLDALLSRNEGKARTDLGFDASFGQHENSQFNREMGEAARTSFRVPSVETIRTGVSLAHFRDIEGTKLHGGLRYDLLMRRALDANDYPRAPYLGNLFNLSPQELYDRYYGPGQNTNEVEHNLSARLRGERKFGQATTHLDLKRFVRNADNGERYYATTGTAAMMQVGNPEIAPEKHYSVELGSALPSSGYKGYGLASAPGEWRLSGALAHDHVNDFITPDKARGQPGIYRGDKAIIYRNVEVELSTISIDAQMIFASHLAGRINLTGAHGVNTTDHRPLYQVAPLEANLFLDTFGGTEEEGWNLGLRLRAVAPRSDVDDDISTGSGVDSGGRGKAHARLDIYGGWRPAKNLTLSAGVENVFDKLYRDHITVVPQTPTTKTINAPERSFYLRATAAF